MNPTEFHDNIIQLLRDHGYTVTPPEQPSHITELDRDDVMAGDATTRRSMTLRHNGQKLDIGHEWSAIPDDWPTEWVPKTETLYTPPCDAPDGFEFAGEFRAPNKGEWFLMPLSHEPCHAAHKYTQDIHILRKLPPTFKRGDRVLVECIYEGPSESYPDCSRVTATSAAHSATGIVYTSDLRHADAGEVSE